MGEGDFIPRGGHRKKAIDPKKLKAMKEQWKKAPKIREKAVRQHQEEEVPKAEEELLKDLSNI
ncbi:hypothetical protein JW752_03075 [Candidatus Peregrinibacteria bacterium]|nr:hypothetical protein [Candidatus Peregrinibacteria bacterium]